MWVAFSFVVQRAILSRLIRQENVGGAKVTFIRLVMSELTIRMTTNVVNEPKIKFLYSVSLTQFDVYSHTFAIFLARAGVPCGICTKRKTVRTWRADPSKSALQSSVFFMYDSVNKDGSFKAKSNEQLQNQLSGYLW